jgi:hypothetical protein
VTHLHQLFHVRRRFFRSVNLAADATRDDACEGYALTPLGATTLRRIVDGTAPGRTERAWSLTGPYGVGKSAFVVLLAQLLAGADLANDSLALRAVDAVDAPLARTLRAAARTSGLCPLLVTGSFGPLLPSLLEALAEAARHHHRGAARQQLLEEIEAIRGEQGGARDVQRRVVALVDAFARKPSARYRGVLLVVDELGKSLEYAAQHHDRVDEVFLLQELAEVASRSGDRPVVLVTLLHQSFERYARDLTAEHRAEWMKVQGRFEDVAFVDAPGEILRLAARSIGRSSRVPPARFAGYEALASEAIALGLAPAEDLPTLRALAPLHPTVALLLPTLCRGPFAQNERSLFGFLTSGAEGGFRRFLDTSPLADGAAPTYTLDLLHEYLGATLGPAQYTHDAGRRWAAIDEAVARLPHDEPALSAKVLKSIGLLGLLGSRAVRASRAVLRFALASHDPAAVEAALDRLVGTSHLVYRRHSDAYALWEGSDIDLDAHFDEARRRPPGLEDVVSLLADRMILRPWVARRHFIETGTLRYFEVRLGASPSAAEEPLGGADGRVLYLLPEGERSHDDLVALAEKVSTRAELLVGVPRNGRALLGGIYEWCAWDSVRSGVGALAGDPVARRELNARLHVASDRLDAAVEDCFGLGDGARVAWVHEGHRREWHGARALSAALSAVCDRTFPDAPRIRNELLNRRVLSSAAAAARRALLDAMLRCADRPRLGIEGTPPEFSMYASLLVEGEIHRMRGGVWSLGPPTARDPLHLRPAWARIDQFLDRTEHGARTFRALFEDLAKAPLGLREGPAAVVVFAVLLSEPDEIAVFEDGTYLPELTDAVIERLLRRVDHFSVARYRLDEGRRAVLEALSDSLGIEGRVSAVALVRAVVRRVGQLPRVARNTRALEPATLAAREVILTARDPLRLLLHDLPVALGLAPLAREGANDSRVAAEYAARWSSALRELASAHPALLARVERRIAAALNLSGEGDALRAALSTRATKVQRVAVDLKLKAFLGRATETRGSHLEWLEGLAMVIGNRPPSEWTDGEFTRFEVGVEEVRALFLRAEALVGDEPAELPAAQREAVEGAEREILTMLEGRLGAQREVWLAALRRVMHRALDEGPGAGGTT